MTTALTVLFSGFGIVVLAVILGLFNMRAGMKNNDIDKFFDRHLILMGLMVIGGGTALTGAVLTVLALVEKYAGAA